MAAPSLMDRAREGEPEAIAALLSSSLKAKGMAVRAERDSYTLHLWFTASPAPPQAATVAYARRAVERLQVPTLGILCLYGVGPDSAPAWREEVALLAIATDGDLPPSAPPPQDLPPLVAPGPDTSAAVERAYRDLGLPPETPLPQVEAVYFRRRAELLKQGDRASLEPLRGAFTTLKTHLEAAATSAARPLTADAFSPVPRSDKPAAGGRSPRSPQPSQSPPAADYSDILAFDNPYTNGLIFPLLLLGGMAMNGLPLVNGLLFGIKIWLHEFGHATVAWLGGRQALPLPIGWTTISTERSPLVYLGVLTLLGLLFWAGRREGKRWPMGLAAGLAAIQFATTWLLPTPTFDMLFSFGGIGGEIYLSALLIVGFFFPLPDYFRWDFYRFPVVLGAAFCFWGQVWLWGQIRRGQASIPFGGLWGDVEHGDMNRLVNDHHWTPGDIIGTYSAIAHLCLLAILAVYAYTLFRQHRDLFVALGRQWLP